MRKMQPPLAEIQDADEKDEDETLLSQSALVKQAHTKARHKRVAFVALASAAMLATLVSGAWLLQSSPAASDFTNPDITPPPPSTPLTSPPPAAATRLHPSPPPVGLNMGLAHMPILGEERRWRRSDEHGILFNMRNHEASVGFDTACGVSVVPLPEARTRDHHIVRFEPYVSAFAHAVYGNVSIVHHMDIYACDETMVEAPTDEACLSDPWLGDDGPCYALLWAYDKGALAPHALPSDAGFRVGAGTNYRTLLLQIHYLLPRLAGGGVDGAPLQLLRASELMSAGYTDSSGVRVVLTAPSRPHDAWSFEFMSYNMLIPAGVRGVEYANRLPSDALMHILGADLRAAPNGTLTLRQVHAHAHVHARSVSLYRMRGGVTERLFGIHNYCGYGECQHFHALPPADPADGVPPTVRAGDELEFRCVYDNPSRFTLGYGISTMTEMCGPILIYTPHDSSQPPTRTWYDSVRGRYRETANATADDAGGWVISPDKPSQSADFPSA